MQRLIDVLGATRHRVIVSMGPRADELRLADNMTGAATLPQTTLMPQVDLVITHGGNNTTTEAMHFGKPMVAAAAVLGPVRQRPAGARARLRRPAGDVRLRRRRADRCRRPAARRHVLRERMAAIGAGHPGPRRAAPGAEIIERVGLEHRAPPVVEEGALRPSRNLLRLDGTHAIRVVATDDGHRAEPVTASGDDWVPVDRRRRRRARRPAPPAQPDGGRGRLPGDVPARGWPRRRRVRAGDGRRPDPRVVGRRRARRREVDDRAARRPAPGGRPAAPPVRGRLRRVAGPGGAGRVARARHRRLGAGGRSCRPTCPAPRTAGPGRSTRPAARSGSSAGAAAAGFGADAR